mmetsp:Transcript_19873/g.37387  ORF Transcript_19873/g.37387 Transcript_19873/m.37387 type:complete len:85 (+) Transcript_19873:144-398(+)
MRAPAKHSAAAAVGDEHAPKSEQTLIDSAVFDSLPRYIKDEDDFAKSRSKCNGKTNVDIETKGATAATPDRGSAVVVPIPIRRV